MDPKLEDYIEDYRDKISSLLINTNEEHPIECYITLQEDYSCGLSSLELPHISKCYYQPEDRTIWFYLEDEDDWVELDDIDIIELYGIYKELKRIND